MIGSIPAAKIAILIRIKTLEGEKHELEDLISTILFPQQEVKQ